MPRLSLIISAVILFAATCSANTIDLTQGSAVLTNGLSQGITGTLQFSFSGAGGITLVGDSTVGSYCGAQTQLSGDVCSGSLNTLGGVGSVSGNPNTLFLVGGLNLTTPAFILPSAQPGQTSLSITLPVIFNGTFTTCLAASDLTSCGGPILLGVYNVNGNGTAVLQFIVLDTPAPGVTIWQMSGATYNLSPVPEPNTMTLLGTGATMLFGLIRRKRLG